MGIDWITVAAQVVNFLILVWLLKRFLYRPITDAIAARETHIASRISEAAQAKLDADNREAVYQDKITDMERRKSDYLAQAQEESRCARLELERKARLEIEVSDAEWRKRLESEHAHYLTELRDRAAISIVNLARKALTDLADETLEAQIERQFEARILALAPALADAVRLSDGEAPVGVITSRFPLAENRRASISRALSEAVGGNVSLEFEEDLSKSPGIVLRLAGLRVGWTIDTYLDALEADMTAHLEKTPAMKNADRENAGK